MLRLLLVLLTGLLLAACPQKPPEKVVQFKIKNLSDHPVKVSYYFFIRSSYRINTLVEQLDPGQVEEVQIAGSRGNPTFILVAEALDDYHPKRWRKLVGNLTWDEGRTFEVKNRHVAPLGSEGGTWNLQRSAPPPDRTSPRRSRGGSAGVARTTRGSANHKADHPIRIKVSSRSRDREHSARLFVLARISFLNITDGFGHSAPIAPSAVPLQSQLTGRPTIGIMPLPDKAAYQDKQV